MAMTIGDRIKEQREHLEISVAALAKSVGMAASTLYDLERGDSQSTTKLHLIAEELGVQGRWLETGKGPKFANTATDKSPPLAARELIHVADGEIPPGYLRLPQLDLPAGAGPGVEMEAEPDVVRWIDVAEQWAEKHFNGHVPRIRVLTARGDSMVGAGIMSGDLLFVDSGITRYDGDGFYILQFMDGWQVKRLRADVLTQQVEIVSVMASGEQAKPVPAAKLRDLRIGGKVSAWWTLRKH